MNLESGKTLIAFMSAAPASINPDWSCTFMDFSPILDGGVPADRIGTQAPGSTEWMMNGTNRASLVSMPPVGTQRLVKSVNIYNTDTSVTTITVGVLASDVTRRLLTFALAPGETMTYIRDSGWQSSDSAGRARGASFYATVPAGGITGTWTSAVSSAGVIWGSGLSIGNATAGGTAITAISSTSSRIGTTLIVNGSSSTFRVFTWAAVQPGDQILTTFMPDAAVSSLSSGLVLHSHCTKAGQLELRVSNVSTLVQNQSAKTVFFTRITPF